MNLQLKSAERCPSCTQRSLFIPGDHDMSNGIPTLLEVLGKIANNLQQPTDDQRP